MKEIELTQNQVALVDDEDFERINQHYWCARWDKGPKSFYAVRNVQIGVDSITGKRIRQHINMASMILSTTKMVDHKNHNTLDNQKQNLRTCTYSENNRNRRKRKGCSSKYKGVYLNRRNNRWYAQIRMRDIFDQSFVKHLGYFEDEEEAAKTYDRAAKEGYGEFACLNFKEIEG